MKIDINAVNKATLTEYTSIPISFEVRSKFYIELLENGLGGMVFSEKKIAIPYLRDYDTDMREHPFWWLRRFKLTNWNLIIARNDEIPIGGAAVVFNSRGVTMLDGRKELALLWDLRVRPEYRHSGIGAKLFAEVVKWSKERNCTQLKIETQDINVPACRFYAKQGCRLGEIHRYKYARDPNPSRASEVMLVWYLDLAKR
jgi:GNAT superfamily N-acetyltransferase